MKTKKWEEELSAAELALADAEPAESAMFACLIAGVRIEVSGPARAVAAIAGAVYVALKDF
tara:strand:+ start:443 stop:625 length:183 start_codon:yes stop_codon:yes gene_type:complete